MSSASETWALADDFPDTPARRAVVSVVRGFGAIARRMGPHYARFGLTPPQFQMLTVLNRLRGEQVTQRRLGRELYVSFPNITVMLTRLEQLGLIERKVNPADRRERFVSITREGRSLLKTIWEEQPAQLESVMAGLDDDERRQLARLMNKMIAGQISTSHESS
ncbi:MAG: MarR family transcriptional regulator [Rhodopirellula sp.]|nr:MarR family transcriptional regulator [Rhodopirellula sp.]